MATDPCAGFEPLRPSAAEIAALKAIDPKGSGLGAQLLKHNRYGRKECGW